MSIPESFEFDKSGQVVENPLLKRFFLTLTIILVAILAFGVGRLSGQGRVGGVRIDYQNMANPVQGQPTQTNVENSASVVFASSKGSKYYYSNCRSTVSDKNKVTFATPQMAESAGYTLAANCHK